MGENLGSNAIRIAIKHESTNNKMIDIIGRMGIDADVEEVFKHTGRRKVGIT